MLPFPDFLSAALDHAAHGRPVLPARGKIPAIKGGGGVYGATTDQATIREWWGPRSPYRHCNIAFQMGVWSWALDVDAKHGGKESLHRMMAEHGQLPLTPIQITGNNGWHIFFQPVSGLRNWSGGQTEQWPWEGIDIRAHGVPCTATPSIHPKTKKPYRWAIRYGKLLSPDAIPVAAAPKWLVDMATAPDPPPPAPRGRILENIEDGWGQKPNYSKRALESAADIIANSKEGLRNSNTNTQSFCIGQLIGGGCMPHNHAVQTLINAAACTISADWTLVDIEETVRHGIAAGMNYPRVP